MIAHKHHSSCDFSKFETKSKPLLNRMRCTAAITLALAALTGCESFLPKETPRYNTVIGERRIPALNGDLAAQSQNANTSPVPLAAPITPTKAAPIAQQQPVSYPAMTARQETTPTPPIAAPAQEPSMLGQLNGWFSSEPPEQQSNEAFPILQSTEQAPQPQPATMTAQSSSSDLEAEIQSLERELQASGQQQRDLNSAPTVEPIRPDSFTPSAEIEHVAPIMQPQPTMSASVATMPHVAPIASPAPVAPTYNQLPPLLPPPPAPAVDFSRQPLPEPEFVDIEAPSFYSEPAYTQTAPVQPVAIPMYQPIQESPVSTHTPSGLIPPDISEEYGQGYLPSSRYSGRRLQR